jgi:hypothetical protein
LLAVYLGQKADQNTIHGITAILSALLGKDEEFTTAKTRGLITSLVNGGILERERERVISSTKVSFHTISPLGYIVLLYVLTSYILKIDPTSVDWDNKKYQEYSDSEENMVFFTIDSLLVQNTILKRILNSLRTGKDPRKIRLTKPLTFPVTKVFSGSSGNNVFKVYEELIWDYLHFHTGLTRNELSAEIDTPIGSIINKLTGFLMIEESWGKTKRYRLSIQGVFMLPIFALLIKGLSVDKSIFGSFHLSRLEEEDNFWISLTKLGHEFFKTIFRIG